MSKPLPSVRTGYLPPVPWTRQSVADRLRKYRREGFKIEYVAPGHYWIAPYEIVTK